MPRISKGVLVAVLSLGMYLGGISLSERWAAADRLPVLEELSEAHKAKLEAGKGVRREAPRTLAGEALEVTPMGKDDSGREMLLVRNRTPFLCFVYVRQIRVGWLRPYHVGILRGMMTGYHHLYAHSQYGSAYWGPRLIWVPGSWTLFR